MFLFVFPSWVCACWSLGPIACLVASVSFGSLFVCILVMSGLLAACLSLLCLALHARVSPVSLSM